MDWARRCSLLIGLCASLVGCHHPEITAIPLSPWNCSEQPGIPFYLPKPLLIIAKNFRSIEEAKVGLTNSVPIPDTFDNQAGYADVNARMSDVTSDSTKPASKAESGTTAPAGSDVASGQHLFSDQGPPVVPVPTTDLLAPETFYTYQIVFVPDLSQKYGLRIKGGVGEIRAAMNLVNGWMFTGLGPYYMKDSSTAQNILAHGIAANFTGRGVADVIKSLGDLKTSIGPGAKKRESGEVLRALSEANVKIRSLGPLQPMRLEGFAQIHIFEPQLQPDGSTQWVEVIDQSFFRDVLGPITETIVGQSPMAGAGPSAQVSGTETLHGSPEPTPPASHEKAAPPPLLPSPTIPPSGTPPPAVRPGAQPAVPGTSAVVTPGGVIKMAGASPESGSRYPGAGGNEIYAPGLDSRTRQALAERVLGLPLTGATAAKAESGPAGGGTVTGGPVNITQNFGIHQNPTGDKPFGWLPHPFKHRKGKVEDVKVLAPTSVELPDSEPAPPGAPSGSRTSAPPPVAGRRVLAPENPPLQ